MSKVFIDSGIILLPEDQVLRHVPADVYEKIAEEDEHPMFVKMTIGHEGDSKGQLFEGTVEDGTRIEQWYKQLWPLKAVKQLIALMRKNKSTPIYEMHIDPEDQSTHFRTKVGSIIASAKEHVDGILHATGIGYIKDEDAKESIREGRFDACSLEADCTFEKADNIFRYVVYNVKRLFGVVLCDSSVQEPGFKNAKITAVVTAMAKEDDRKGTDKTMTIAEVKQYIKDHGVSPEVLFSVEDMTKLPKIKDVIDNDIKQAVEEKEKKIVSLTAELEPYKKDRTRKKVVDLVDSSELIANEDKKVAEYLKKIVDADLSASKDDAASKILVDAEIKRQLSLMKEAGFEIKGTDEKGNKDDEANKGKKKEEEHAKKKDNTSETEKMTKPENNPLIPQLAGTKD